MSPLTLQYYIYLVSLDCLLEQKVLFFYSKYLETVGWMDCFFFFGFGTTQKFNAFWDSSPKEAKEYYYCTSKYRNNTQEVDVLEKRLAWNFNMQIVTRKVIVPERNQGKITYFFEHLCMCVHIICTRIHTSKKVLKLQKNRTTLSLLTLSKP